MAAQSGQVSQRRGGKSWLDTMAAITVAVAMQPASHEYHLMESPVSARLFFLDNVETDTPDIVVSLMVVSSDNPPDLLTSVSLWGNLVITGAGGFGNSPRIIATDKETGKVVWETSFSDTPDVTFTAAPLAIKDKIIKFRCRVRQEPEWCI
jgi:hypothetical protein